MMEAALSLEAKALEVPGDSNRVVLEVIPPGKGGKAGPGPGLRRRNVTSLAIAAACCPVSEGRGQPCLSGWQLSNGSKAH